MIDLRAPLVLASGSPRRRRLVSQIVRNVTFDASEAEEHIYPEEAASDAVCRLALDKAVDVSRRHEAALILGADTVVVLDGSILGKPVDANDAAVMLRALSGRTHVVFTGLALIHPSTSRSVTVAVCTKVHFDTLSVAEIAAYVRSGAPLDKAGAYGIQDDMGSLFVQGVEGDYFNVVGLPLNKLYRLLLTHFNDLIAA